MERERAQGTSSPRSDGGASLQVGTETHGEDRRQVTVLFADVTGSTELGGRLDPEDLRAVLGQILRTLAEQVAQYGGTVDKYVGDAVMAVFGAPISHEEDPELAVQAALAMRDAIAAQNTELESRHGARLELRIGINTGEVVAGTIASEVQSAYTVVGDTVNTAQRLQAAATPGGIFVGPQTYLRTAELFRYERTEPIRLKGKAEPLDVHRVLGSATRLAPTSRRRHRGVRSAIVGRVNELALIGDRLDQLATGQGGALAIVGEAGVGKTRLLGEAHRFATARSIQWYESSALSFSQSIGYWPFIQIVRSFAGIADEDAEPQAWAKLERAITELVPANVADVLPYVAGLLSLRVRGDLEERVRYLDGVAMGRQVFRASRLLFEGLAKRGTTVLAFEDLHWLDASSAALLEHILPLAQDLPLLVIATGRPERGTPAAALRRAAVEQLGDRYGEVALSGLSPQESAALVHNLTTADLPPRVLQRIVDRTGGNPFFLEEVIRSFIDLGALAKRSAETDEWYVAGDLEHVALPGSLRALITARLDRLPADLASVLRTASVLGRTFYPRVLGKVLDGSIDLALGIRELAQLELIVAHVAAPEPLYAFKHAITQEAAYEGILLSQRRDLHLRVARAMEDLFGDRLDEFYGMLAYHYARAEDWPNAQAHLLKAGDQARKVAANEEALAHYREAIEAYVRAFGDRWDPLQRASLDRKIGDALFRRGDHDGAREYLYRALAALDTPVPPTSSALRRSLLRELLRQVWNRLFVRSAASTSPSPAAEEIRRIYESLGGMDYYYDPQRFLLWTIRLLNRAEREGDALGIASGSFGLGIIADLLGLTGLAAGYHHRTATLGERIGSPFFKGIGEMGLAYHKHRIGRWTEAAEHWDRAATLFWDAGEMRRWGASRWGGAWLAQTMGDTARSRQLAEEMIRVGREGADAQVTGWGAYLLGRHLRQRGELTTAQERLGEAVELLRSVPDLPLQAQAQAELTMCHLRQGDVTQAVKDADELASFLAARRLRGFLSAVHGAIAEAFLAGAEASEGDREALMSKAKRALRNGRRQIRIDRGGLPGVERLSGTFAFLGGDRRAAERHWTASVRQAESLGYPYELGLAYLESGSRLRDADRLRRSMEIFERLSASAELARARAALATVAPTLTT